MNPMLIIGQVDVKKCNLSPAFREKIKNCEHSSFRKKMKVCIVSTHYPSDDAIGEYCGHMAAELSKTVEVIVLANKNTKLPTFSRIQTNGDTRNYAVFRIWKSGFFYPFTIFRSIIRQKPDIVHVQHEYFLYGKGHNAILFPIILFLSRLTCIPLVVTMHHVIPTEDVSYFRKLLRTSVPEIIIKLFLTAFNGFFALSSKIIVPSAIFKKTLSSNYRIGDNRINIIPHFTDTNVQRFLDNDGEEAKTMMGLKGKKVILFYGFIRPTKGIEYILYALQKVKDIIPNVLLIVDGKAQPSYISYFNYLEQLVVDLELSNYVRFENIPKDFSPTAFAASDVVVFPYISTIGMTPIAHLTAAAFGKPIIATNIDSFSQEFSDHENALLVPPKDADALSDTIIEIFTNNALSKKLSNNVTQYCEERSKEKVIDEISKIYQDLLETKKSARGLFN
jgi:glycosyltransferase involved in cell wall biosynthesis